MLDFKVVTTLEPMTSVQAFFFHHMQASLLIQTLKQRVPEMVPGDAIGDVVHAYVDISYPNGDDLICKLMSA